MNTWKATTAGILEIVAGALHLVSGVATVMLGGAVAGGLNIAGLPRIAPIVPLPLIGGIGIPLIILGIIALIGGISALQRKRWGLALAGGICALFPLQTLLGIPSIVFVALAHDEFGRL
jgi:hypothetical protein